MASFPRLCCMRRRVGSRSRLLLHLNWSFWTLLLYCASFFPSVYSPFKFLSRHYWCFSSQSQQRCWNPILKGTCTWCWIPCISRCTYRQLCTFPYANSGLLHISVFLPLCGPHFRIQSIFIFHVKLARILYQRFTPDSLLVELNGFYCCRRHRIAIIPLLCSTQYFCIVDNDI